MLIMTGFQLVVLVPTLVLFLAFPVFNDFFWWFDVIVLPFWIWWIAHGFSRFLKEHRARNHA